MKAILEYVMNSLLFIVVGSIIGVCALKGLTVMAEWLQWLM
jgi:hypothetical protein